MYDVHCQQKLATPHTQDRSLQVEKEKTNKMKFQIYLLILIMNFGCSGQSEKSNSDRVKIPETEIELSTNLDSIKNLHRIKNLKELSIVEESNNYETIKRKIDFKRNQIELKNLQIDSISKIFEESLINKIIPFWEGTEWSFEGHTSKPKSGKIACGYFVSTTLQDIGLNLNRYRLAQQSPINEARSLSVNTEVKEFSKESKTDNILAIKQYLKEGIHFIGFNESHVGYILKKNGELYLIHSNYINAVGVEIEQIEESEVFDSYSKFYIVQLSTNKKLLNYWKYKREIEIIKK